MNTRLLQTRERIDKYCEKFEKDMLDLFDRCYRKEDPKMMHVSFRLHIQIYPLTACPEVLCANVTRFQWRNVMCPDICEPTRLLYQSSASNQQFQRGSIVSSL